MTNACTNRELGKLLHAWEIGLLGEADQSAFEQHLLVCAECSRKAAALKDEMRIIRHDQRVQKLMGELGENSPSLTGRSKIVRLLAIAALFVLISIPLYRYLGTDQGDGISQELTLLPIRSGNDAVIDTDVGGQVRIKFVVDGAGPGSQYSLTILSSGGDTTWTEADFRAFNSEGLGVILLPVSTFDKGFYHISIMSQSDSTVHQVYNFRVK